MYVKKEVYKFNCQYCNEIVERNNISNIRNSTCFSCKVNRNRAKSRQRFEQTKAKNLFKCVTCNDKSWNSVAKQGDQCDFCKSLNIKIC